MCEGVHKCDVKCYFSDDKTLTSFQVSADAPAHSSTLWLLHLSNPATAFSFFPSEKLFHVSRFSDFLTSRAATESMQLILPDCLPPLGLIAGICLVPADPKLSYTFNLATSRSHVTIATSLVESLWCIGLDTRINGCWELAKCYGQYGMAYQLLHLKCACQKE